MVNRNILWKLISITFICGTIVMGCMPELESEPEKFDNAIYSVSITLYFDNNPPKVGGVLSTRVENKNGSSVSSVSYQWKRADSRYSTFVNINNATSNQYTTTIEDADKYIKVEARNNDTTYPVESAIVGPINANQVAKPTADPAGGDVVSGHEITLTSDISEFQNATIYYTLDGTTPTSSSTQYYSNSKPKITSSCTLKAIATWYGMVDSEVISISYTVVAAPTFSSVTSSASIFTGGIYSVAYGNNKFVAGGNSRYFGYSSNGTSWTDSNSSHIYNWIVKGITYGTQFVAVGSWGIIKYSSDGISWNNVTDTTFGESYINDVAYGNGRYVAVGDNGKIAYSTYESSWTAVTDSTFGTSTISGITYGAGKFVAVGSNGKMAYSTNGTTWTAVTDSGFYTTGIYGITYGGPSGKEKFIAVGYDRIAYSNDGVIWTIVSGFFSGGIGGLNRVVWGGNKYVVVAGGGVMYYSLDGAYWAKIDGGTGTGKTQFDSNDWSSIEDIVYAGGRFLAVGSKYDVNSYFDIGEIAISTYNW